MYAETGLLFPYLQNFSQEIQQLEEYCMTQKFNSSMSDFVQSSAMSEYDLLVEGDLFKAPETIIEEPNVALDPMAVSISMISCGEDVSSQGLKSTEIDAIQNEQLLSEVFYECRKDLLEKAAIQSPLSNILDVSSQGLKSTDTDVLQNEQLLSEVFYECKKDLIEKAPIESPLSDILEIKVPALSTDENSIQENKLLPDLPLPKSVSSGSLSSMDWMHGAAMRPAFFDFSGIDFNEVYGMRRAFSEGDIKTLGNGNINIAQSPHERPFLLSNCTSEERREKLLRYRDKKSKRNFGRKIKYACRKALADSQPRIRGRFARTEESDVKRE